MTTTANEAPAQPSSVDSGAAGLKQEDIKNAVIRFAGNSQDGIQSIGGFLARLAGRSAREVMTYMTIPSTISGGPSIFQVHLGSGKVLSPGDDSDILVAFYQHSYEDHIEALKEGGVCLYDSDHVEPDLYDKRFKYVPVPMTGATVEAIGGTAKDRGKNMFVLGLVTSIFGLDRVKLGEIIDRQFARKGEDILRNVMLAFDAGYAYPVGDLFDTAFNLQKGEATDTERVAADGNTTLTYGLLAGGVRYGAGYPITPWSGIMETLRTELPKYGGLFVQCEDELAAVSMALGAAYAGHLSITGSSGPGLSLKMEALSYATMAELPLVIINVQRGGPSTGLPTSVEQSDLMQAIYGSHGDTPRVVIAPKNVEDCYYVGIEACRIAREYSVPVIVLSDQAISSRIETFREPDFDATVQEATLDLEMRPEDFKPYPLDGQTHHAPPGAPIASGKYPVVTGLEHDEMGHPTANADLHQNMTARRRNKLRRLAETLPVPEIFGAEDGGDILLVGWGSTWGPISEATIQGRDSGLSIASIHMRHVHPLPNGLEKIFDKFKHILVVEMNDEGLYGQGQLATLLRSRYCNPAIQSITKTDGLAFRIREILAGIDRLTNQ